MRSRQRALLWGLATGLAILGCGNDSTSPVQVDSIPHYINVKHAWRPGERDSTAAFIQRNQSWGIWSGLASSVLLDDSADEIVRDPAWRLPTAAPGFSPSVAASQFSSGWGALGMDIRIVFDSNMTLPGIQLDSINWIGFLWWNPADSTWKGFIYRATTAKTFGPDPINTTDFDNNFGQAGAGGGESQGIFIQDTVTYTYWEADGGTIDMGNPTSIGATLLTFSSGPYLNGNYRTLKMTGNLTSVTMTRKRGPTAPPVQTFTVKFSKISGRRIFCYYTPVTPPSGYTSCTGAAFAHLIEASRAGRSAIALSGAMAGELLAPADGPPPATARRRH